MTDSKRVVGCLAGICVLAAFLGFCALIYRWWNKPIEVERRVVQNAYEVQAVPGKWIDTGVWIAPFQDVTAVGDDLYTLAIETNSEEAVYDGSGDFRIRMAAYPCFPTIVSDHAWVTKQGKLYFYSDKATKIHFRIGLADNEPCAGPDYKHFERPTVGQQIVTAFAAVFILALMIAGYVVIFRKPTRPLKEGENDSDWLKDLHGSDKKDT